MAGRGSMDVGARTTGGQAGWSSIGHGAPLNGSSNVESAPGGILSSNGLPGGFLLGGEQLLHRSGFGYRENIPVTTDLARGDIDETQLRITQVFWPVNYTAPTLPVLVKSWRNNNIGDDGLIIRKTKMVEGMVHFNVDIRQVLTGGVFHQEQRVVQAEKFGRDIYNAWTTHLYSTKLELANPQVVEDNTKKWESAHSGVLTATEAYVRRAMVLEMPCIYNLSADENDQTKFVRSTYMICNRNPLDFVSAIYGIVNEGIIGARFIPGDGVMGNTLLVPRVAFVRYFGNAAAQARTLYEHRAEDKYMMYTTYAITPSHVVTTATTSEGGFRAGNVNVVPYDGIPLGVVDGIGDEFFQRRVMQASVVIPAGAKSALIRTPNGSRVVTTVDAAIAASVYFEDNDFTDSTTLSRDTHIDDDTRGKFMPTIGGTWAMQTPEAARALIAWLSSIVDALEVGNVAAKIKLRTGEELAKPTIAEVEAWYPHMAGQCSFEEAEGKAIMQLAMLPGNRTNMTYLHSVVPFAFCTWTLYIAGFATFGDAYLIHPQCMTLVSADNLLVKQYDPTTVRPPWIKINSTIVSAYTGTLPDIRIPSAYAENITFSLRRLGTAPTILRTDRIETIGGAPEQRRPDAFAVFSGVMQQTGDWCYQGPDSITHMPSEDQIRALIRDRVASDVMIAILQAGEWIRCDDGKELPANMTQECDTHSWVPFPARVTMTDDTIVHQKGYEQLEFPVA